MNYRNLNNEELFNVKTWVESNIRLINELNINRVNDQKMFIILMKLKSMHRITLDEMYKRNIIHH